MNVSFYGHTRQYHGIKSEIDTNISRVLESGQYVMGPMLKQFEAEFAAYTGKKHAIGVGNGTDAISLTIMALGLRAGDEIITHANTFFATAEAIWIAGCKAVLVDCDEKTRCIDPKAVAAAITPRTKAIIPVHLYGQCAPMREIRKLADKHKLFVIEDNAQAIDARGDDFRIGELSDAVTTSFIIQKNLGTFGDGGAVYTDNADDRRRGPQAPQPRLHRPRPPQLRLQQPPGRHPRRHPERQAEAHHRVERAAPEVGGPLRRGPEGRRIHRSAVRAAGLPPRVSTCTRSRPGTPPTATPCWPT